jgi:hypothetical protein
MQRSAPDGNKELNEPHSLELGPRGQGSLDVPHHITTDTPDRYVEPGSLHQAWRISGEKEIGDNLHTDDPGDYADALCQTYFASEMN